MHDFIMKKKNSRTFGKEISGVNVFCINKQITAFTECKITVITKHTTININ